MRSIVYQTRHPPDSEGVGARAEPRAVGLPDDDGAGGAKPLGPRAAHRPKSGHGVADQQREDLPGRPGRAAQDPDALASEAQRVWGAMGAGPCVVEQALDLDFELSVMVARDVEGRAVAYPAARNHHEDGILRWSVLPGGFGTLDEFFEVLTWRQLRLHDRPIVLVDLEGYWRPLLRLVDHLVERRYSRPENRELIRVVGDIDEVLPAIFAEAPPRIIAKPGKM